MESLDSGSLQFVFVREATAIGESLGSKLHRVGSLVRGKLDVSFMILRMVHDGIRDVTLS